jgi:hypothetical protein
MTGYEGWCITQMDYFSYVLYQLPRTPLSKLSETSRNHLQRSHRRVQAHCSKRCVDAATSEKLPFPTLDE